MSTSGSSQASHVSGDEDLTDQSQGTKRKVSFVWSHFTQIRGVDNIMKAKCVYCGMLVAVESSDETSQLSEHLLNSCPNKPNLELEGSDVVQFAFDELQARTKLAITCIKHKLPFDIAEHEYFAIFLKGLNPDFELPNGDEVLADVISVYKEEKIKLKRLLGGVQSRISLSTDIWSSEDSLVAYCCLTIHFIDEAWELQKKIITFKNMAYPHEGENFFDLIRESILEWNLDKNIFSVVVDNDTPNDSMISRLKHWLVSNELVGLNGDLVHVRCSTHIVNLVVQDWLSQISGVLEKIRETAKYLKNSFEAAQTFEIALNKCNLKDKRQVTMDVPNKWKSTYELLETALPLREAFSCLQRMDNEYLFNPSESEWDVASVIHDCLRVFYEATSHFSGSKCPTSNVFFPDICWIHLKMNDWEHSEHDFVRSMARPMKEKFDKYWEKHCLVFAIAVVFDPRYKMSLVQYYYTKIHGSSADSSILDTDTNADYKRWMIEKYGVVTPKSELESYLDESMYPNVESFSILDWWRLYSPRFPVLAKIARDVLAVPGTTCAFDEAFNVGGPVINESRASLDPDVVEALILADDWIRDDDDGDSQSVSS